MEHDQDCPPCRHAREGGGAWAVPADVRYCTTCGCRLGYEVRHRVNGRIYCAIHADDAVLRCPSLSEEGYGCGLDLGHDGAHEILHGATTIGWIDPEKSEDRLDIEWIEKQGYR